MGKGTSSPSPGAASNGSGRERIATVVTDTGAREHEVILGGRRYRLTPVDERAAPEPSAHASPSRLLTARELQIVALVAEGFVNKQVAAELRISEWTVSTHLRRIYAKLGVDTRAAMVSRCAGLLASLPRPLNGAARRQ